jgi:MFS family permease
MRSLTLFEIFLLQVALWLGAWLWHSYLAALLTLIIGGIVLVALLVALVSEWIEPSKVPRRFFRVMWVSVLAPVAATVLYACLAGGLPIEEWMQ